MAPAGAAAPTAGRTEEGSAATDEEAEAEGEAEERGPQASLSLMLRPNAFAGWKSFSASRPLERGSRMLRSSTSTGDTDRRPGARFDRSTEGAGHLDECIPAPSTRAAGRAVASESELPADGARDYARSSTAADRGSPYKTSLARACCYWNKKIFFSRTRWHYLFFLCIYAYLIGPLYLNWAPLRELLFRSGAYAWECDPQEQDPKSLRYISAEEKGGGNGGDGNAGAKTGVCTLQRLRVANLYTVCAATDFGFSFFGGFVVDWLGPKTGSLIGSSSMLAGWLLLALSTYETPLYIPGMVSYGIGIDMAFYGTMSVPRLFPGHANTVLAAVVGMRCLAYMTPLILNSLPLSYSAVMLGYGLIGLLPAVLIASLYAPWKPFHRENSRRGQQRKGALSTTSGSSRDGAQDAAARSSHVNLNESSNVAAQEIAVDTLNTIEMVEPHSGSYSHHLLMQQGMEKDHTVHCMREMAQQKGWQQEGGSQQEQQKQRLSGGGSARSENNVARARRQHERESFGYPAQERQRLLQPSAAQARDDRESHSFTVVRNDSEYGWLSGTSTKGQGGGPLFSPFPQHHQEERQRKAEEERWERRQQGLRNVPQDRQQIDAGEDADALEGYDWQERHENSSGAIDKDAYRTDSRALPPVSFSRVRPPGEFFTVDDVSCPAPAQRSADASFVRTKAAVCAVTDAQETRPGGANSAADDVVRNSSVHANLQRPSLAREARSAGTPPMLQLQHHGVQLEGTPMQQAKQHPQYEGSTWSCLGQDSNRGDEEQQGPTAAFHEDSEGSNKDKNFSAYVASGHRTLSTAADEESTEVCGAGSAKAPLERNMSVKSWDHANLDTSGPGASGGDDGGRLRACIGERPGASSPLSVHRTGRQSNSSRTSARWDLERGPVKSPTDCPSGRASAVGGVKGPPNEAHAAALLQNRQISLRWSLSSRQFPRTCTGRMRYFMAYLRQHPWTVHSVNFVRNYLLNLLYLPVVPYFAFSLIRSVYFSDASEDLVPSALATLHVLLACVCVVPPVMGVLADMCGIMPCLLLVNTTGTLVILGSLLAYLTRVVAFEYIAVIFYMPFAAVLTNQVYFYVSDMFPQRHLGKLCGFASSIGGVASLSVTSMFEFSVKTTGGFTIMLFFMLALSGLCYGLIGVLYIAQKKEKGRRAAAALSSPDVAPAEAASKHPSADATAFAAAPQAPHPEQGLPAVALPPQWESRPEATAAG